MAQTPPYQRLAYLCWRWKELINLWFKIPSLPSVKIRRMDSVELLHVNPSSPPLFPLDLRGVQGSDDTVERQIPSVRVATISPQFSPAATYEERVKAESCPPPPNAQDTGCIDTVYCP